PIGSSWSARFSFLDQHRDDWVNNEAPGRHDSFGGYDEQAARGQIQFKPSDTFTALLNVHGMNYDGSAIPFRANIIQPGCPCLVPDFRRDEIALDGQNFQRIEEAGANLHLTWSFPNMELASITGFDRVHTLSHGDIDGGFGASFAPPFGPGFIPFPSETADGLPFHRQITQEVHLASKETTPLEWIVGAYYFNENITIDSHDYATLAGDVQDGFAQQKQLDISYAVFGSIGYQVNDQFKLRGGLRYTHDDKYWTATRTLSPIGAGPVGPLYEDP